LNGFEIGCYYYLDDEDKPYLPDGPDTDGNYFVPDDTGAGAPVGDYTGVALVYRLEDGTYILPNKDGTYILPDGRIYQIQLGDSGPALQLNLISS